MQRKKGKYIWNTTKLTDKESLRKKNTEKIIQWDILEFKWRGKHCSMLQKEGKRNRKKEILKKAQSKNMILIVLVN